MLHLSWLSIFGKRIFILLSVTAAIVFSFCQPGQCQERSNRNPPSSGAEQESPASRKTKGEWPGLQKRGTTLLPNGWSLKPAGDSYRVGDFPVRVELDPSGNYLAVLHAGYGTHEIHIIDSHSKKQLSTVAVDQTFFGMNWSNDGKTIYVSGGEYESVYAFPFEKGFLAAPSLVRIANKEDKFFVSDLVQLNAKELLVCGLKANELVTIDLESFELLGNQKPLQTPRKEVSKRYKLPAESFPYAVVLDAKKERAFVSLWGQKGVAIVDLVGKDANKIIQVDSHPTEMVLSKDERHMWVACADSSSVNVISVMDEKVIERINTALYPKAGNGSTPSSLAISSDERALLIANSDNNNLAMFDVSEPGKSHALGFIPTGWYPTSVRFLHDDAAILVTNGKGDGSKANRNGPNPLIPAPRSTMEYIGGLMQGTISVIPAPTPLEMETMSKDAYAASPLTARVLAANESEASEKGLLVREDDNPIPAKVGDPSPIRHCFYIIKENRTYDQVFGDIPEGNGDPTICIFGKSVTPNHHKIVNDFVLLDNFYVESEVSADGHEWTMAAYATDYVEKTWPLGYRAGLGKLGYPSEGQSKIAQPSSGYFWDRCAEYQKGYFSFGEFIANGPTKNDPARARVPALEGHYDPLYRAYDLDYSDLKRADRFLERLKQFEEEDNLPQFVVARLPNDHTYGTRAGKLTPTAMVAQNDFALGKVIEGISRSKYWKDSAIFVVEDDAQNGSDHVDAHRTVAMVISPYVKRGSVDSTMYSTSCMLRTMGLIIGVPPMTQFDAAARPMYGCFQATPDFTPYVAVPNEVDIEQTNTDVAWGSQISEELDFSREDAADDLLLNDIVWRSVRGPNSPMPPPVRAAFVFTSAEEDEEDEDEDEDSDDEMRVDEK